MQFQTMSSFPKPAWPPAPPPTPQKKTAQRNLFHLRRKTGRCLVLSVWIDVCVSVSLVIFDNSATSPSYLVRNRTLGQPLENNPEIPPSSTDEGLRLLHGLETNLATSLETPQEA